jgi:hypothetical protein
VNDEPLVVRPGEATRGRTEGLVGSAPSGVYGVTVDRKPRCSRCGKVLAWFVSKPWKIRCDRCGLDNGS